MDAAGPSVYSTAIMSTRPDHFICFARGWRRAERGHASVAWLALLVAMSTLAVVFWTPLTGYRSPIAGASYSPAAPSAPAADPSNTKPGASAPADSVHAWRTEVAALERNAEAGRGELARRVARLEDLFPQGLAGLEAIEVRHRDTAAQRDQLVRLYRASLADSTALVLEELDDLLAIAARQADSPLGLQATLALVEAARQRATRRQTDALRPVIAALDADLARLRAAGEQSPLDAADRLRRLAATIDKLPFEQGQATSPGQAGKAAGKAAGSTDTADAVDAVQAGAGAVARADATPDPTAAWWQSLIKRSADLVDLDRAQGQSGELLRVRRVGESDASTLPPAARYFVVQNLRLRLHSARLSLLVGDDAGLQTDLRLAATWLDEHFDTASTDVASARQLLDQLLQWQSSPGVAGVRASLDAVARLRESIQSNASSPPLQRDDIVPASR